MRVNLNHRPLGVRVDGAVEVRRRDPVRQPDREAVAQATELARALNQIPAVRAGKVAAARALVQDPAYPSEAVLSTVAAVLADHFKGPGNPEPSLCSGKKARPHPNPLPQEREPLFNPFGAITIQ